MKKQYVNPQCEYWCYVTDQLCSVGEALYAMARKTMPGNPGGVYNSSAGSVQ